MQERMLKVAIIALTTILAMLIAFGAFLVAGTQQGDTAPVIKAAFKLHDSENETPAPLPVEDKKEYSTKSNVYD